MTNHVTNGPAIMPLDQGGQADPARSGGGELPRSVLPRVPVPAPRPGRPRLYASPKELLEAREEQLGEG
ncbi:hypothetical protein GCM10010357_64680 [Streptomyces luteireticuli]|uniref:Uncharacterized protein n=1 Tax=Streptomyces luteireticuli TaxID=173858 RepID=A0ABP3IZJ4_9ACTN